MHACRSSTKGSLCGYVYAPLFCTIFSRTGSAQATARKWFARFPPWMGWDRKSRALDKTGGGQREILMNWQRAKGWDACWHQKKEEDRLESEKRNMREQLRAKREGKREKVFTQNKMPWCNLKASGSNKTILKIAWCRQQYFSAPLLVYLRWIIMTCGITDLHIPLIFVPHWKKVTAAFQKWNTDIRNYRDGIGGRWCI